MLLKELPDSVESQIQNKLVKRGDCLIWTGPLNKNGRPVLTVSDPKSKRRRTFSVQKLILDEKGIAWGGEKRYCVNNTCGNKKCCNADHLEFVPFSRTSGHINNVEKLREERRWSLSEVKDLFRDLTYMSYKAFDKKHNMSANKLHHYMLSNTVLYPYFTLLLKEFYGDELVAKVRNKELTATELKQQFGLSRCVKTILTSEYAVEVKREKLYLTLLSSCAMYGCNVVWEGSETLKIAVSLDNVVEASPAQALAYAVYGTPLGTPVRNTGWYRQEMNPFKLIIGETDANTSD